MKKTMAAVFAILLVLCCGSVWAAEPITEITLASEEWEDATNADGTGLYWDIFRAVYEPENIKLNLQIRPYAESMDLVKRQEVDAGLGAFMDEIDNAIFPNYPFAVEVVAVVYKKGSAGEWQGETSLSGKRVGWITGYAYDSYFEVPMEKNEFDTREDAYRALEEGRIDFYMDDASDISAAVGEGVINASQYAMQTVKSMKVYAAYANNDRGRKLSEIWDRRMEELVYSGEMKKIYSKYSPEDFRYPF